MLKLPSIALEVTARCNQRCTYCYNAWRSTGGEPADELSTAELCRLMDRLLAEAELGRVNLTGGEPFLRADILDLVDHANARGLPVTIISNGRLVDDRTAQALAARRVDYVQVTLTGPDAATHDAHCGAGSFEGVTGGVGRLVAAGVPVGGSFLCTRRNFGAARATLELLRHLGARHHVAFNRFNPSGHAVAQMSEMLPARVEVLAALAQARAFAEEHDTTVHCTMPIPSCMADEAEYPRVRFGQCSAGCDEGEYAVDPQGRLKLCTLQPRPLGSLLEHGLAELIGSEPVRRFRSRVPAFCEPCPHRAACLGGCGAAAEWVFGRADALDPFLAQHVQLDFWERVATMQEEAGPQARLSLAPQEDSR